MIKGQLDNFEGRLLRVAIVGAPGMGKSQLALKAVDKLLGKFAVHARLDASDETTLRNGFFALAQQLRVVWDERHPKESEDRVLRHLFALDNPWLLILDNVKPNVEFASELSKRLAGHPKVTSVIIAASQFESWPSLQEPWEAILLEQLDNQEAVKLLQERVRKEYNDLSLLKDIATKLHGLPLALSAAGGYMNEHRIPPESYLSLIKENSNSILSASATLGKDAKSVLAVVGLSIEQLSEGPRNVLYILSLLAPSGIPRDLVRAVVPSGDKDLSQLLNVTLATGTDEFISIHQLIQQTAQLLLPRDDLLLERLFNTLIDQAKEHETGLQEIARRAALVPHLQSILQHTSGHESENLQLLSASVHASVGDVLQETARFSASLEQYQAALEIRLRLLGQSAVLAASHSSIGSVYVDLGKYNLALIEY